MDGSSGVFFHERPGIRLPGPCYPLFIGNSEENNHANQKACRLTIGGRAPAAKKRSGIPVGAAGDIKTAVLGVPQRKPAADSLAQNLELFMRPRERLGRLKGELRTGPRLEVPVTLANGVENRPWHVVGLHEKFCSRRFAAGILGTGPASQSPRKSGRHGNRVGRGSRRFLRPNCRSVRIAA